MGKAPPAAPKPTGQQPPRRRPRKRKRDPRLPAAGSVIKREYKGSEYEVIVRASDFEFEGRSFPTLSWVAREITGTNWNGFLFFGLSKRGGGKPRKEAGS